MMKIIADSDIVLELYLARDKWVQDAETLMKTAAEFPQLVEVYATEIGLGRIRNYLNCTNPFNPVEIIKFRKIEKLFNNCIIKIDNDDLKVALTTSVQDMDAAVELVCAKRMNFGAIIAQQPEKFSQSALIQVLSVSDLLNRVRFEEAFTLEQINKTSAYVLPEDFKVYVGADGSIVNGLASRYEKRIMPTINAYMGDDGGYIACYSHNKEGSIYPIGDSIYIMGQIRLQGHYIGQVFHPQSYENQDISAAQKFKDLCNQMFPACKGDCWAGGDTGGWFGG